MKRRVVLRALFLLVTCVLSVSGCLSGNAPAERPGSPESALFDFYIPWYDAAETAISLNRFLDPPAGKHGFIIVREDGHLGTASGRMRFWGVNTAFGANFPDKKDAPMVAAHLAKFGVNLVRFHHMDMYAKPDGIWKPGKYDRELDEAQLDKLNWFIYQLKQHGVYADLNLLVSRPFNLGSELNDAIDQVKNWKVKAALGFFDPAVLALQQQYARDLLTHVNPYTKTRNADEPAVAFIEINNENGLVQTYLNGDLDDLPVFYRDELKGLWNAWLSKKYKGDAALRKAWQAQSLALRREMLANADFGSGGISPWRIENHQGAASTQSLTKEGPQGLRALRLEVIKTGSEGWHVQVNQPGLEVAADTPYTLSFFARADAPSVVSVEIGMAHDPWQNLGFSSRIELGREWKRFEFPSLVLHTADANARLNFGGLGLTRRTTWIADVSLRMGGSVGLSAGESLDDQAGIGVFSRSGSNNRTREAMRDWFAFLLEQESRYWNGMRDYIKRDLKARPLVFGTIVGCSTPTLMAELDLIDAHAYWNHPVFPNREWDQQDWYVENTAMVNHPDRSTLAGLFVKRVQGKPFAVSEYNHSFPNGFEAEAFPLLAAYASLQDWDVLIPFAWSHRRNDWDAKRIPNFFDIDQNPVKLASFIPAAAAFLGFDVSPARRELSVGLDRRRETELLPAARAWKLVDGESAGLDPLLGFEHRLSLNLGGGDSGARGETTANKSVLRSDTGELVWDVSERGRGVVTVDTGRTKMVIGFSGGKRFTFGPIVIEPEDTLQNGFSVLALTILEGDHFKSARRLLVTALGAQMNPGAGFRRYEGGRLVFPPAEGEKVTLGTEFGRTPSRVEGIRAVIELPFPGDRVSAWALDSSGKRTRQLTIAEEEGQAQLRIGPEYKAVWYEVVID